MGFVHGEFGTAQTRGQCPNKPIWQKTASSSELIPFEYQWNNLFDLVHGGLVDALIRDAGTRMADRIYALLTNPLLGNKENARYLNKNLFSSILDPLIETQSRIRFIVPSFPFKDQNPLRAELSPNNVDLGEIALLIRLYTLSIAIFQVHPFGADWIIVSDGLLYAPTLYVDEDKAASYMLRLIEYRNFLIFKGP